MPTLYGLFVKADLVNVSSFRFLENSEWDLQVARPRGSANDGVEAVEVRDGFGSAEWHDIRGSDRRASFRSCREASVRSLARIPGGKSRLGRCRDALPEYADKRQRSCLVAVFECEGCEPVAWTGGGTVQAWSEDGEVCTHLYMGPAWSEDGEVCTNLYMGRWAEKVAFGNLDTYWEDHFITVTGYDFRRL